MMPWLGQVAAFFGLTLAYQGGYTSWGDPDLQGNWNNSSMTSLERKPQFNNGAIATEEEAARAAQRAVDTGKVEAEIETRTGSNGQLYVIAYDSVWRDMVSSLAIVDGKYRASWISDPPDGRIPYSRAGKRKFLARGEQMSGAYNPEDRLPPERCLTGYGSVAGPVMLNTEYNSNYRIVQSPGFVIIISEMVHDARIIRLNAEHGPKNIRPWLGDSVGHWEGRTLVVETTNVNPQQDFAVSPRHKIYLSPDAVYTERFTRTGPREILYEFAVSDPTTYTQTWRGEIPWRALDEPLLEYACAEGDRTLEGILGGARRDEKTKGFNP